MNSVYANVAFSTAVTLLVTNAPQPKIVQPHAGSGAFDPSSSICQGGQTDHKRMHRWAIVRKCPVWMEADHGSSDACDGNGICYGDPENDPNIRTSRIGSLIAVRRYLFWFCAFIVDIVVSMPALLAMGRRVARTKTWISVSATFRQLYLRAACLCAPMLKRVGDPLLNRTKRLWNRHNVNERLVEVPATEPKEDPSPPKAPEPKRKAGGPPPPPKKAAPPPKAVSKALSKAAAKSGTPAVSPPFQKRIFWQPMESVKGTVFNDLGQTAQQLPDTKMLHSVFGRKAVDGTSPKATLPRKSFIPKSPNITMLDGKRAHTLGIIFKRCPVPLDLLCETLHANDLSLTLAEEDLNMLLKVWPTNEEQKQVQTYAGSASDLRDVEQCVQKVAAVPRSEARLRFLLLSTCLNNFHQTLHDNLHEIENACDELLSSQSWRSLIAAVLSVGNYINHGEQLGVKGFNLDVLQDLSKFKGVGGLTALHIVCITCARNDHDFCKKLFRELKSVPSAAKVSLAILGEQVQRIRRDLEDASKDLVRNRSVYKTAFVPRKPTSTTKSNACQGASSARVDDCGRDGVHTETRANPAETLCKDEWNIETVSLKAQHCQSTVPPLELDRVHPNRRSDDCSPCHAPSGTARRTLGCARSESTTRRRTPQRGRGQMQRRPSQRVRASSEIVPDVKPKREPQEGCSPRRSPHGNTRRPVGSPRSESCRQRQNPPKGRDHMLRHQSQRSSIRASSEVLHSARKQRRSREVGQRTRSLSFGGQSSNPSAKSTPRSLMSSPRHSPQESFSSNHSAKSCERQLSNPSAPLMGSPRHSPQGSCEAMSPRTRCKASHLTLTRRDSSLSTTKSTRSTIANTPMSSSSASTSSSCRSLGRLRRALSDEFSVQDTAAIKDTADIAGDSKNRDSVSGLSEASKPEVGTQLEIKNQASSIEKVLLPWPGKLVLEINGTNGTCNRDQYLDLCQNASVSPAAVHADDCTSHNGSCLQEDCSLPICSKSSNLTEADDGVACPVKPLYDSISRGKLLLQAAQEELCRVAETAHGCERYFIGGGSKAPAAPSQSSVPASIGKSPPAVPKSAKAKAAPPLAKAAPKVLPVSPAKAAPPTGKPVEHKGPNGSLNHAQAASAERFIGMVAEFLVAFQSAWDDVRRNEAKWRQYGCSFKAAT